MIISASSEVFVSLMTFYGFVLAGLTSGVEVWILGRNSHGGVLVDGPDFSDDKMLIGRTFSYSDTQRYRVGPNYFWPRDERDPSAADHRARRDRAAALTPLPDRSARTPF